MIIKLGDYGTAVRRVQRRLQVPQDGHYGPITAAAVHDYQAANCLKMDGIVGPATWRSLFDGPPAFAPTLAHYGHRTTPPSLIVVHHSDTASDDTTRQVLQLRQLSTHYEITRAGERIQYLDPTEQVAWHCGGGVNSRSIGIDCTHFGTQDFPAVQVAALVALTAELCDQFGIPRVVAPDVFLGRDEHNHARLLTGAGIYRHRNLSATICPAGLPLEVCNG